MARPAHSAARMPGQRAGAGSRKGCPEQGPSPASPGRSRGLLSPKAPQERNLLWAPGGSCSACTPGLTGTWGPAACFPPQSFLINIKPGNKHRNKVRRGAEPGRMGRTRAGESDQGLRLKPRAARAPRFPETKRRQRPDAHPVLGTTVASQVP